VAEKEAPALLSIDGREVRITNPSKPYFCRATRLSKLDVVRYYLSVAEGALRGIRDRPLVLKRFVGGAEGQAFYQKRAPGQRPAWLRTVTVAFRRSSPSRKTITRKPSHFGSKIQPEPSGSASARLASIGRRGGEAASFTRGF